MTQNEFDSLVIVFAQKEITYATKVVDLRRQGDPLSQYAEERQIFLNNVLMALRDYDVTSDVMEQSEIDYLFELATLATESWP